MSENENNNVVPEQVGQTGINHGDVENKVKNTLAQKEKSSNEKLQSQKQNNQANKSNMQNVAAKNRARQKRSLVRNGDLIKCSHGLTQSVLQIPRAYNMGPRVLLYDEPAALATDNLSMFSMYQPSMQIGNGVSNFGGMPNLQINILSFGMCSSKTNPAVIANKGNPVPCTPVTRYINPIQGPRNVNCAKCSTCSVFNEWSGPTSYVFLNKERAVCSDSILKCMFGGEITISHIFKPHHLTSFD